jgi:hypothetical protein
VWISLIANAFLAQGNTLMYAKAVLLVDDNEGEVFEIDALLEERVRTNNQRGAAIGN